MTVWLYEPTEDDYIQDKEYKRQEQAREYEQQRQTEAEEM